MSMVDDEVTQSSDDMWGEIARIEGLATAMANGTHPSAPIPVSDNYCFNRRALEELLQRSRGKRIRGGHHLEWNMEQLAFHVVPDVEKQDISTSVR